MAEKKYDWLRFWGPRDGKFSVNGYGALEDPHGAYGNVPKLCSYSAANPTKSVWTLKDLHRGGVGLFTG